MATSENLTPSGLPYGERQEVEAGRQQAGLPLGTGMTASQPSQQSGRPQPTRTQGRQAGGAPIRTGTQLLADTTPGDFPFLADAGGQTPPTQPASEPDSPLRALGASANSQFGTAVIARLMSSRRRG